MSTIWILLGGVPRTPYNRAVGAGIILGLFLAGASALSPASVDLTADYIRSYEVLRSESSRGELIEALRAHHVILVPGFLSGLIQSGTTVPDQNQPNFSAYYEEVRAWMKSRQIDFEFLQPPTQMGSRVIAPLIRAAVDRASRPVLIVSQSKGGLDTLLALEDYPEIRTRVVGWISIQSPFWGSPVADSVLENSWAFEAARLGLEHLGSSIDVVRELSTRYRAQQNLSRRRFLRELMEKIPSVFLATFKRNEQGPDTFFEPLRNFLQARGYLNDGVVPWNHAILPNSHYVILHGLDHSAPVKKRWEDGLDRVALFLSLVRLNFTVRDRPTLEGGEALNWWKDLERAETPTIQ